MMDAVLLSVLLAAVAIGFGLGYRQARKRDKPTRQALSPTLSRDYFVGLNYLLNEQPDEAIHTFIRALEVNSDNVDTHIALGKLFRTRGEADKAVSIHQNLLARPALTAPQNEQVQLELARDFIALGVHDRAQRLLESVIGHTQQDDHRITAKRLLIDLLEREKAWQQALDLALPMLKQQPQLRRPAAHWLCEMAEDEIRQASRALAKRHLKKALQLDEQCVRANLRLAELEMDNGHYRHAIARLKSIPHQARAHIPTMLPTLKRAYWRADDMPGFEAYLLDLLETAPLTSVIVSLSEVIHQRDGVERAIEVTGRYLHQSPSLGGLDHLIDLYIESQQLSGRENPDSRLLLLKHHTQALLRNRPRHRCQRCGFSADSLHWLCPSCRHWGTVEPITGVEGE
ncbi:lipopolysaccharide assembly protein LapB [Vreelandella massiliensis]|uniref:lipopolysaccharide assembly protein LapB n=1 Tax=Vreelandella massiliensis TaxID=1816686 RepID=UPI00096A6832|nr:lipopolysaccharide assembly protein LapB [Halomonas massiliensis]